MKYPLPEKIGNPDLLVGREKEFEKFEKWIDNIPKKLSKSRVILARRKSGKTSFVQRIFNRLWSENGDVIPFYFDIAERKMWYPDLAIKYYRAFASQYISFLERDEKLVREPLSLEAIREYGLKNSIKSFVNDVKFFFEERKIHGLHDSMWETAYSAPHVFAAVYDKQFLVIIDEFQNITQYIYRNEECRGQPDETLAGSFHSHSESKIAPMLVTGSYVRWLINISSKYLEAGRLSKIRMSPYLTPDEGLQAVYKYSEFYNEPITNDTAILINKLCMSDPFFISCVIQSNYEDRDLTTEKGVLNTVNYEISDRDSEMSETWREYIELTLQRVNDIHAKNILLFLSKNADRFWNTREIKKELELDLDFYDIQKKLLCLVEADVIEWGTSDIQFRGLQDGTLNLILRSRFEEEIKNFAPDLKQEFSEQIIELKKDNKRLQGMLNNISGKFAELQLAYSFRAKKSFALSDYFNGVKDKIKLNIIDVKNRVIFQSDDGKSMEFDIIAESNCGRAVVVEVKKTKNKTGIKIIEDFFEKIKAYSKCFPDKILLPAFLSLGGFTNEALQFCKDQSIGTADRIKHF
ncbi:ATPase domain protein, prokaryote domain protein [Candidatus Magnetomoraceae bacterium gMMP-1]